MFGANILQIGRLRLKSSKQPDPAFRLTIFSQLDKVELKPSIMPPAAVLIINKLGDPLPVALTLQALQKKEHEVWQRAVQTQLEHYYHNAVRPVLGKIPVDAANAILFADGSEMLACLALDIQSGEHRQHWWWQSVLANLPASVLQSIGTLLAHHPRELPSIINYWSEWGQLQMGIRHISQQQTIQILQGMLVEQQLGGILPADISLLGDGHDLFSSQSLPVRSLPAPWAAWCAAVPLQTLLPAQQCLVGVALGLMLVPNRVRDVVFSVACHQWWKQHIWSTKPENPARGVIASYGEDATPYHPVQLGDKAIGDKPLPDNLNDNNFPANLTQGLAEHAIIDKFPFHSNETATNDPQPPVPWQETVQVVVGIQADGLPITIADSSANTAIETSLPAHEPLPPTASSDPRDASGQLTSGNDSGYLPLSLQWGNIGLQTHLSGIFYLLNLMRHLDLPACFQPQCQLEEQIGFWGLLEVLARALLAEHFDAHADDPVWALLCRLDGREAGQAPAVGFRFTGEYQLPEPWLEAIRSAGDGYYQAWDGTYHWLWSDAGFILHRTRQQALAESWRQRGFVSGYSCIQQADSMDAPLGRLNPLRHWLGQELLEWLSFMFPALELRLRQALALGANPPDYLHNLLLCPATLYDTGVHIDWVSSLEHISLPVRMAGLDRDPGWLPAIGRVVSFHYR